MFKTATTPGEKLKELRSFLNLKQADIISPDISRPLISLYENNKVPINHKNLLYFHELFSKIALEKDIIMKYTFDEFIKSVEEQLNDQAIAFTKYIRTAIQDNAVIIEVVYQSIIKFVLLENISAHNKYLLHETISDYNYLLGDQQSSFYYMEKAFDSVLYTDMEDEQLRITNKVIRKGIYLKKKSLNPYLDLLKHYINSNNKNEIIIYHYNRAIVYKLYGDYENALTAISQISDEWIDDPNKRYELILFRANINEAMENYDETLRYLEKLKNSENEEYQIIAKLNEINVLMVFNNNKELGKELFNEFKEKYLINDRTFQSLCSAKYLPSVYYYIAKFYQYNSDKLNSKKYIKKILENLSINTNIDILKGIFSLAIEFIKSTKDNALLELTRLNIEESFEYDSEAFKEYLKDIYAL